MNETHVGTSIPSMNVETFVASTTHVKNKEKMKKKRRAKEKEQWNIDQQSQKIKMQKSTFWNIAEEFLGLSIGIFQFTKEIELLENPIDQIDLTFPIDQ